MNRLFVPFLCACVVQLTGCAIGESEVPLPLDYPTVGQREMQAAYHWSVLAEYEAERIIAAVKDLSKPIYLEAPTELDSQFIRAYHNMLQTHLVTRGAVVLTKPIADSIRVIYHAQILKHKDRDYTIFSNVWKNDRFTPVSSLSISDMRNWTYLRVEPTEIIVTTQVLEGLLLLHSGTDIFYYNPGDTDHYRSDTASGTNAIFAVVDDSMVNSGSNAGYDVGNDGTSNGTGENYGQ